MNARTTLHEPDPTVEEAWAKLIAQRAADVLHDRVAGPECE